ncbi:hypothetical protein DXD54_08225 [Clostridium sp. TM06-18]|nr:hypothetical protein DXD54_08225 [Clostridium sp. TM06-18]
MITLFIMRAVKDWKRMLIKFLMDLIMFSIFWKIAECICDANWGNLPFLILICIVCGVIDLAIQVYFQLNQPVDLLYMMKPYIHFNILFWDNDFHHAVKYQKWNKIDGYASEFKKITDKYANFSVLTESFDDLPVEDLEKALNIFAEINPKFFTQDLINIICSDVKRGLHNGYFIVEDGGCVNINLAGDHGFIKI